MPCLRFCAVHAMASAGQPWDSLLGMGPLVLASPAAVDDGHFPGRPADLPCPHLPAQLAGYGIRPGWLDRFQALDEIGIGLVGGAAAADWQVPKFLPPRRRRQIITERPAGNGGRTQRKSKLIAS